MKKILFIIFLFFSLISSATNYYVKTGGNDSNTGLSDAQAWAHHPWMNTWTGSVTLALGDNVYMKRGDTWTIANPATPYLTVGQSGTADNYITTTAYGTGAKPIINISTNTNLAVIRILGKSYLKFDDIEISHYSSVRSNTDRNGIWIITYGGVTPHHIVITNCRIHNIPSTAITVTNNAHHICIGDSTATSTATSSVFSNEIYDCGYAGIILFGTNPVTLQSHYDVYYNYIHDIDMGASAVEDAYCINFGAACTVSVGYATYCNAKYNYIKNNPWGKGIDSHGGRYLYVTDNYIYNVRTGIDFFAAVRTGCPTPIMQDGYIERNIVEKPGTTSTPWYFFIDIGTESSSYKPTNCYIRDNICFFTTRPATYPNQYGIMVYHVDGITIEGNLLYNGPIAAINGAIVVGYSSGDQISNVIVRNNAVFDWNPGIRIDGTMLGNIQCYNNISISQGNPFYTYALNITSGILSIYNNTFLSRTSASIMDLSTNTTIGTGTSVLIKNNILGFTSSQSSGRYLLTPTTITGTFASDYNLFWNSTYATPFTRTGTAYSFTDWKGLGYDTNSPNVTASLNPLFVNAGGSYLIDTDVKLQSTSPAINEGVDVGLTTDYGGNPIFGFPDIGAWEFISTTNYYVDPNGHDDTGNGSAGNPWYSLSHACSVVTTPMDKIFVNAGSYIDNNKCILSLGVLIEGDLNTPFSIITTSYVASSTADAYIVAASPPGNAVNGNQSISYIRINGNSSTATRAIYTAFRSNVIIHHCTFTNFHYQGIRLNGTISAWNVTPTNITPTNNEVHDCTFTNCANLEGNDGGHIRIEGQNSPKIYNDTFIQTGAPLGHNTDIFAGYQNEGLEIHDCVFYKNNYENGAWNFFAELHYSRGGFQMYGNIFNGAAAFDFSGSVVGTWGFGAYIHDNTFQTSAAPPSDAHRQAYLDLESFAYENDIYVYRNHFKFCRIGIHLNNIGISANNIWIYDNILEDIGNTTDNYSYGIKVESNWNGTDPTPIDNLYIYHNVIDAGTSAFAGIHTYVMGMVTNQNIRNNIIIGNFNYPIMFDADQNGRYINTLNINNDIFYGCVNNSIFYTTEITYTGRNDAGNFIADPLFVDGSPYDFHLSSAGSPAYHAGIYVSLPMGNTDYDLVAWYNPPSIGAYEYGGVPPPPAGTAYSRRAGKYVMKFGKIIRR